MVEKIRFGGEWSAKKTIAAILFGAIIFVFALWGVRPANMGDAADGVAAIVNDRPISISEFRSQVEQVEQNARMRFDSLPAAQRNAQMARLRQQVLENMIISEVIYQSAHKKGVIASDSEVRDQILQIPFFQENGRFLGDRYRLFLQNRRLSAEDFEREIRKRIVTERLQELFIGSSAPAQAELKRNHLLANYKLNLRFAEITPGDYNKLSSIGDAEVRTYLEQHKSEVESYYKDNLIEFSDPEKYHAKEIVIRIDEKRSEAEAKKIADEVHKQLTPQNFAKLAAKYSEDPGDKTKGGDLGELERGSQTPQFEAAALALSPGQISVPLKIQGAYHLIYLVNKKAGGKRPLEQVQSLIAKKLLSRSREPEVLAKLRETVEKREPKEVEAYLATAGLKWKETGDFDLSSAMIPKLGESKDLIPLILKQGRKGGLIRQVIPYQGSSLILNVVGWREEPDKTTDDVEGLDRMVAYRKAEGAFDSWIRDEEARASIQRNNRISQ